MKKILFALLLLIPVLTMAQVKNFTVPGTVTAHSFKIKADTVNDTIFKISNGGNLHLGLRTGKRVTTGTENIFFGNRSGFYLTTGYNNTLIGADAGNKITTGYSNVLIGREAGYSITTGYRNVIIGKDAGRAITTGDGNMLLGTTAGYKVTTGTNNTIIGYQTGYNLVGGSGNILLGYQSGYNVTGSGNVFIGFKAGLYVGAGDYRYILALRNQTSLHADSTNALDWGYQGADTTKSYRNMNADVTIGSRRGQERFNVRGNAKIYGDLKVTGYIYPKVYESATEPDIPNNSFAFWYETVTPYMFIIMDYNGTQYIWKQD